MTSITNFLSVLCVYRNLPFTNRLQLVYIRMLSWNYWDWISFSKIFHVVVATNTNRPFPLNRCFDFDLIEQSQRHFLIQFRLRYTCTFKVFAWWLKFLAWLINELILLNQWNADWTHEKQTHQTVFKPSIYAYCFACCLLAREKNNYYLHIVGGYSIHIL